MEPKDTHANKGLKRQKQLLTVLIVCSILLAILLGGNSVINKQSLRNFDQIDSLANIVLRKHRLGNTKRNVQTIEVDSLFERKTTRIGVPVRFSKTLFHLELAQALEPWGIEAPARVFLPEDELHIHISLKSTIVRSLQLFNDSSAVLSSFGGQIMMVSDFTTDQELFEYKSLFADQIPHVIQLENVRELENFAQKNDLGSSQILWFTENNNGLGQPNFGKAELERIVNVVENPAILILSNVDHPITGGFLELIDGFGISVYLVSNFWISDKNSGINEMDATFDRYLIDAKSDRKPTLLFPLKEMSLELLRKKLPAVKLQGFMVVPPKGL